MSETSFYYVFSDEIHMNVLPQQVYAKGHLDISEFCRGSLEFCKREYPVPECQILNPRHSYYRNVPDKESEMCRIYFDVKPGRGASPCTVADIKPGESV